MYKVRGKYKGHPWEDIDEFDTLEEAIAMRNEYRIAFGPDWMIRVKEDD